MPVAEILKGVRTLQLLGDFFNAGTVLDTLAGVEFEAARKAFSEVPIALDCRGQLHVCIGHLNSCLAANRAICRNAKSNWRALSHVTAGQHSRVVEAKEKVRFLLCLLAACYAYLGDYELCRRHLADAYRVEGVQFSAASWTLFVPYMLANLLVPVLFFELAGRPPPDFFRINDDDLSSIERQLMEICADYDEA